MHSGYPGFMMLVAVAVTAWMIHQEGVKVGAGIAAAAVIVGWLLNL